MNNNTINAGIKKERDYQLDNAKAMLIVMVVVAHFVGAVYSQNYTAKLIYNFINLFHMPAFMMISGFFSKRRINERDYAGVFKRLLVPYLLYYSVGVIIDGMTGGSNKFNPLNSSYGIWYILVLGIFTLITPLLLDKLKGHLLWVSVVVMCISLSMPQALSGSLFRVLTYYPYFLIGYFISYDSIRIFNRSKIVKTASQLVSLLFFIGVAYFVYRITPIDPRKIIWHITTLCDQFKFYSISDSKVILLNVICTLLAVLCSFAVVLIAPRKKTFFSYLGQYSIYIYVLHIQLAPLFKYFYNKNRFFVPDGVDRLVDTVCIFLLAVLLAFFLASKPVRKVTRAFVEPRVNLSFIRKLVDEEK